MSSRVLASVGRFMKQTQQFPPQRKRKCKSANSADSFSVKRMWWFAQALELVVSIEYGRSWAQWFDCSSSEGRRLDGRVLRERFGFSSSCRSGATESRARVGTDDYTYHICEEIKSIRLKVRRAGGEIRSSPWVAPLRIMDWVQLILAAWMVHLIHHLGRLEGER